MTTVDQQSKYNYEAFQFFAENDELPLNHILPAIIRALGLPVTMGQLREVAIVSDNKGDLGTLKNVLATFVETRKPEQLNNKIRKAYEALKD